MPKLTRSKSRVEAHAVMTLAVLRIRLHFNRLSPSVEFSGAFVTLRMVAPVLRPGVTPISVVTYQPVQRS
jgi:hypothetical protein